ncbi:CPBP family intramembrane glutamic endopeptidase [Hymenobacter defluvii]|uniref:CPBP family intramembrane metalloprotease n=1 Tax=Hymenobacter defluvii TaxID=2054411 RepID=A0ABS3TCR8_9BACT|nr:CPBP family intramembrane glutamic endopeptidase [Hymenobacter defluvii]MBO3270555.1 CPBP family intramembrane metalloprotease [Hymenobacter defluvii]
METIVTSTPILSKVPPTVTRSAYPTIAQSWGVLGWFLLLSLLVGIPTYLVLDKLLHVGKQTNAAILSVLINVALMLVLRRKAGRQWARIQWKGQAKPWIYAALPILVITYGIVASTLVELFHLPNWMETTFRDLVKQPLLALFLFCVSAPLLEELIFRGVMLTGLLRNYRPWVAISQSALLFGLMHMNPAQIVGAGLIGLLFGWLYYRTRSLSLCIVAHMFNNLLAFLAMTDAKLSKRETMREIFGTDLLFGLALLISVLLVVLIVWQIHKRTQTYEGLSVPAAV